MTFATARARANIALVKYWGKRNPIENIPAVGSISMTLSDMHTTTRVSFERHPGDDRVLLNGEPASPPQSNRISHFLDRIRNLTGQGAGALVESDNNFPTAAGLASSASGFAALAAAASQAAGLRLAPSELADLALRGSGSAPRSLLGGFVELVPQPSGCRIELLGQPEDWDLRLLVVICNPGPKKVGSSDGMERSRLTSAFYQGWIDSHPKDLENARRAIRDRDLAALGETTEISCFKLHAVTMTSRPPLLYFAPTTLAVIQHVFDLRQQGLIGYVTVDAGPQVKVLCAPETAEELSGALRRIPGVTDLKVERPGPGLELLT